MLFRSLLDKISRGRAGRADLGRLESLADMVRATSLCGLGQGSPNPVSSTLRYFRNEYLAHIDDRVCAAGTCPMGVAAGDEGIDAMVAAPDLVSTGPTSVAGGGE